ncbi:MAG: SDR family NAD(P)-dependent oxidoreductase [Planctomycetota bacterium]|nr:SDR family NAD(P)-dependent oxidoreductase [Planctomycetota bacterium]MDA1248360.1 SDR family NAD(P)-dependent oxidoreductase [Planctomycetota bacterium]
MTEPRTVFITGVSAGIGFGLTEELLERGWRVIGLSRREPSLTIDHEGRFLFQAVDVSDSDSLCEKVSAQLEGVPHLDLVVLNAGILGEFGDLREMTLDNLQNTMNVNVWSNKLILDAMFEGGRTIEQVVTVSSGAAVNGNRGWGGYSISKAALNMLTSVYAKERPETHFCAFAPGVVETAMQDTLQAREPDERFPSVERLRAMRGTDDMPDPREAARRLLAAFEKLPQVVTSGDFADIRNLPD